MADKPTPPTSGPAKPNAGRVKVKALRHLGEVIDGNAHHFNPGDVFEVDAERAKAIAHSVQVVK